MYFQFISIINLCIFRAVLLLIIRKYVLLCIYSSWYMSCVYVDWLLAGSEWNYIQCSRGQLKCDGTRAQTRFRLSMKRTSPFKSAEASVQLITGSRGVRISGSNAGYTMFRGGVKGTDYPLHSPVSSSIPLPCVTVCHHISTGIYLLMMSSKLARNMQRLIIEIN